MSTVQSILAGKDNTVYTVGRHITVLEATQMMNRHKVGALIIEHEGRVIGMFTERDVLRRVVAEQRDPATTRVSDVMTAKVVCCTPATSIDDVRKIMKTKRIRHIPVVNDDEAIQGIISIGDLNAFALRDGEVTIQYMQEYIYGRA